MNELTKQSEELLEMARTVCEIAFDNESCWECMKGWPFDKCKTIKACVELQDKHFKKVGDDDVVVSKYAWYNMCRMAGAGVLDPTKAMPAYKLAYVCSPYRGDIKRNVQYAKAITAYAIDQGYAPIVPHLYMPTVLDDNNEIQRKKGLAMGLALLDLCDCIVIGLRYGVSEGMKGEIHRARMLGKEMILVDANGEDGVTDED